MDWMGILIGAAIAIAVSWFFYVRAARGLQREAEELKQQTQLIMRGLQEGLDIEFNQDEQGNIIGVGIKLRVHMDGSSSASATPTVRQEDDASADQTQRMQDSE